MFRFLLLSLASVSELTISLCFSLSLKLTHTHTHIHMCPGSSSLGPIISQAVLLNSSYTLESHWEFQKLPIPRLLPRQIKSKVFRVMPKHGIVSNHPK